VLSDTSRGAGDLSVPVLGTIDALDAVVARWTDVGNGRKS
jgi:hypothetical protein